MTTRTATTDLGHRPGPFGPAEIAGAKRLPAARTHPCLFVFLEEDSRCTKDRQRSHPWAALALPTSASTSEIVPDRTRAAVSAWNRVFISSRSPSTLESTASILVSEFLEAPYDLFLKLPVRHFASPSTETEESSHPYLPNRLRARMAPLANTRPRATRDHLLTRSARRTSSSSNRSLHWGHTQILS